MNGIKDTPKTSVIIQQQVRNERGVDDDESFEEAFNDTRQVERLSPPHQPSSPKKGEEEMLTRTSYDKKEQKRGRLSNNAAASTASTTLLVNRNVDLISSERIHVCRR